MEFDPKQTALGIELGSTRIKAVLLDRQHQPLAVGIHDWENRLVNGIWTYPLGEIHAGIRSCFARLAHDVQEKYGKRLETVGAIGVSAMMHGYFPLDAGGNPLSEFRTWRNTITGEAADKLTKLFDFNIPQRWSIAHLYQAMLNGEAHLKELSSLTTLAGYIHWRITGSWVVGVGEASGMFPIDSKTCNYDARMMDKFDALIAQAGYPWRLADVLPGVLPAGKEAGRLMEEGAQFLDPTGTLCPGIPVAPPEGDAGTGMVATNAVRVNTGNVSAGTSDFAMVVVDHQPGVHREIDMVTTPTGRDVAMVHCNNCTSDLNAWVNLFEAFAKEIGAEKTKETLFTLLFNKAADGDLDCGNLLSYNYYSGEGITDMNAGRPVFVRMPDSRFTLANFMRTHLMSALATLKIGLDILTKTERIPIDKLVGHGGFFKTERVGQLMLSAASGVPVSVLKTAGEGGAYGMALLAGYMLWRKEGETLESYLDKRVYGDTERTEFCASPAEIQAFDNFLARYKKAFAVERTAVETVC